MKASFDQNDLEQGYGRITLTWEAGDVPYAEDDAIAVGKSVGANEYEFIGSNAGGGWMGSPQPLKFASPPQREGDNVIFLLHPAYVDMMDDGIYTVALLDGEKRIKAQAPMEAYDIAWSGLANTDSLPDYQAGEVRKKPDEAEGNAARAPWEEEGRKDTEPVQAREERDAVAAAGGSQGIEPGSLGAGFANADEAAIAPPGAKKGGKGLVAALVILSLLLLAGGGYYWHARNGEQEEAETARLEAPPQSEAGAEAASKMAEAEAAEAARQAAEAEAAENARKAAEAARKADAKGRVGAFFAGPRSPEAALKLAEELDKETPEQQDAVFRLYYYGQSQDDPQASLKYAECLDPSRGAWGTVKKDAVEAWLNYARSPAGEEPRRQLKAWVEREAAAGNSQARAWLAQME